MVTLMVINIAEKLLLLAQSCIESTSRRVQDFVRVLSRGAGLWAPVNQTKFLLFIFETLHCDGRPTADWEGPLFRGSTLGLNRNTFFVSISALPIQ